jgi:intracellular multiplication protein IcmL
MSAKKSPSSNTAMQNAVIRNQFYKDGIYTIYKIALIEGVVIVALVISFIIFLNIYTPPRAYFAVSENDMGQIMSGNVNQAGTYMQPMTYANVGRTALMSWVAQATSETMTFGLNNYQRRLQEASRHFTDRGWDSFAKAIEEIELINTVVQNRQILYATPRGSATVVSEGFLADGTYEWIVDMPLMITYELGGAKESRAQNIRVNIRQVPLLQNPMGVGIDRWQII